MYKIYLHLINSEFSLEHGHNFGGISLLLYSTALYRIIFKLTFRNVIHCINKQLFKSTKCALSQYQFKVGHRFSCRNLLVHCSALVTYFKQIQQCSLETNISKGIKTFFHFYF